MIDKQIKTMEELVEQYGASLISFRKGDIIEVEVASVHSKQVLVNISDTYYGIVPERELSIDYKELKPGDKTLVYIMNMENRNNQAVLSLKRADRERISRSLRESYQDNRSNAVPVKVKEANRGGLIVGYGETEGFLPVSQLNPEHYPRVGSDNKDQIQSRLSELIGKTLKAKVITFEPQLNKIIFSERAAGGDQQELLRKYKTGQKVEGQVSGIVDFGVFVDLGDIEGLIHISELSWDRVDNIKELFKERQKIQAEIIAIEDGKISLSMKRLQEDPWIKNAKKYKVNQKIKGEVTRITPFGAFVKVDNNIEGLAHISEIMNKEGKRVVNAADIFKLGKKYGFRVLSIDSKAHKFSLTTRMEDEEIKAKKKEKQLKLIKNTVKNQPERRRLKRKPRAKNQLKRRP